MLKVVCAIISDDLGRYLLVQRASGMRHPLKWEFPGGKVEPDEQPEQAIRRELREELEIEVATRRILSTTVWEYPGKKIGLIPIICELRLNHIRLREHRDHGWFFLEELGKIDLLEADRAILNQLK